jgi:hypothetical protein
MLSRGTCQRLLAVSASFQAAARYGDGEGGGCTVSCSQGVDRLVSSLAAMPAHCLRGSGEQQGNQYTRCNVDISHRNTLHHFQRQTA